MPPAARQIFSTLYGEARSVVVEDLGDVPLVSVDFFIDSVLPPVDSTVLENIKAALIAKKRINKKNGWSAFPKSPKATATSETRAFSKFPIMIKHIVEAASPLMNSEPALQFVYNLNETPVSERNNYSRPDSQLELKTKKSLGAPSSSRRLRSRDVLDKTHWEDIVLPCEFKLDQKDYEDNICKLIWSAHHVMRTDPCRRFTFGITVEDSQMRLWFFARSHVMVTHPFNFLIGLETVIHIFTSLVFSDLESLGFDPTVSRIQIDNEIRYKFRVGEEFYITTETLADHAADFIRGRGTRVFKAYHDSDRSRSVVLKDVWLEDGQTEEGFLLESIRAAVVEMQTQGTVFPGNKDPSAYFLTVSAHGRVKVSGQTEDHTTNVIMRGSSLPSDLDYFSTSRRRVSLVRDSRVIGPKSQVSRDIAALMFANLPRKSRRFPARIHYRIVFNEVGRTIHNLHHLSDVYQCLADVTIALEIMHMLGYVHRDVSAGNILFWEDGGILSDLESAKKTTDLSTHEVRTGTNQYESVEVRQQRYLFRYKNYDEDGNYDEVEVPPPFKFNCIHDLESVWWIALWVLFHHAPVDDKEDRNVQILHALQMFPSVGSSMERLDAFVGEGVRDFIKDLAPTFRPIAKKLIDAVRLLIRCYIAAEKGPAINETAFNGLHQKLVVILQEIRDMSQHINYKFVLPAKRGATEEPTSDRPGPSKRPRTGKS